MIDVNNEIVDLKIGKAGFRRVDLWSGWPARLRSLPTKDFAISKQLELFTSWVRDSKSICKNTLDKPWAVVCIRMKLMPNILQAGSLPGNDQGVFRICPRISEIFDKRFYLATKTWICGEGESKVEVRTRTGWPQVKSRSVLYGIEDFRPGKIRYGIVLI